MHRGIRALARDGTAALHGAAEVLELANAVSDARILLQIFALTKVLRRIKTLVTVLLVLNA